MIMVKILKINEVILEFYGRLPASRHRAFRTSAVRSIVLLRKTTPPAVLQSLAQNNTGHTKMNEKIQQLQQMIDESSRIVFSEAQA